MEVNNGSCLFTLLAVVLAFFGMFFIVGVETTVPPAPPSAPLMAVPTATPSDVLRIGLVTHEGGEIDDQGFNQSVWLGVQAAAEQLGAEVNFIETQDSTDYAANIAEFAANGYDVIVTVGVPMNEATRQAALEYPDMHFVGVDQFQAEPLPNLTGLIFPEDRAGYLAGVLAGRLTDSGVVAGIYGTDLAPSIVAFGTGFESGVLAANPDARVITTFHPGGFGSAFSDPEWGAATAAQAIDQGADVVFAAGGFTGVGALIETAHRTTDDAPLYCIGVDVDQWETVPEAQPCLVSSAVKRIDEGVMQIVIQVADGIAPAGNFFGGVGLADFHDFADVVPADVQAELEEVAAGLEAGEIDTGYHPGG